MIITYKTGASKGQIESSLHSPSFTHKPALRPNRHRCSFSGHVFRSLQNSAEITHALSSQRYGKDSGQGAIVLH